MESFSRTIQMIWPASCSSSKIDPQVAARFRMQAVAENPRQSTPGITLRTSTKTTSSPGLPGEKPALDRELGMYVPVQATDAAAVGVLTRADNSVSFDGSRIFHVEILKTYR